MKKLSVKAQSVLKDTLIEIAWLNGVTALQLILTNDKLKKKLRPHILRAWLAIKAAMAGDPDFQ